MPRTCVNLRDRLVGWSCPRRPQAAPSGGPGAAPPALRSASRAPLLTGWRKCMSYFIFRMRRSPVLQHAACESRVPFGGVGCPGLRLAATMRGRLLGAHQRGAPPRDHITPTAVPYAV